MKLNINAMAVLAIISAGISAFSGCSAKVETAAVQDPIKPIINPNTNNGNDTGDTLLISAQGGDKTNNVKITPTAEGVFVKALKHTATETENLMLSQYSVAAVGCSLSDINVKFTWAETNGPDSIDGNTAVEMTMGKEVEATQGKTYVVLVAVSGIKSCSSASLTLQVSKSK